MLRWGLNLSQWKSLSQTDEDWYFAHDAFVMAEVRDASDVLAEKKALNGEVALSLILKGLGL